MLKFQTFIVSHYSEPCCRTKQIVDVTGEGRKILEKETKSQFL